MKKKHKILIGLFVAYFVLGGWMMFVSEGTFNEYLHLKELLRTMYLVEEKETWAYKNGLKPPPLPNYFENRKTRLGIDSDKNGIRDDIDFIIHRRAISHNHFHLQYQMAKTQMQFLILDGYSDRRFRAGDLWSRTISCSVFLNIEEYMYDNGFYSQWVHNNNERYNYKKEKYFERGNSFSIAPERNASKVEDICDFIIQ